MPMIMDEDLDDLFGDGAPLEIPSVPHLQGLSQKVDETRLTGCCQYVIL